MPIATIDTQRNPSLSALAAALNQSSVVLGQALNNAIQRASQDDQNQLTQEQATLTEQQRNIANERAERFDKRDRAEFISEFGRKLDRDAESDRRFEETFGLSSDKFREQKRSNLVQEGLAGRRVSVAEEQVDDTQTRFDRSLKEKQRQFNERKPQRDAATKAQTLANERASAKVLEAKEDEDFSEAILKQFGFDAIGTENFNQENFNKAREDLAALPEPELQGVVNAAKKSDDLRLQQLAGEAAGVLAVRTRERGSSDGSITPAEERQRSKILGERTRQFNLASKIRAELRSTDDPDREAELRDRLDAAESAVKGLDEQLKTLRIKSPGSKKSTFRFDPDSGPTGGF